MRVIKSIRVSLLSLGTPILFSITGALPGLVRVGYPNDRSTVASIDHDFVSGCFPGSFPPSSEVVGL